MGLELVSKDVINESVSRQAPLEEDTPVYTGSEHRANIRRITVDRREMVRFEDKSGRRSGKERRVAQQMWDGRDL
jgi:hypothetical protein